MYLLLYIFFMIHACGTATEDGFLHPESSHLDINHIPKPPEVFQKFEVFDPETTVVDALLPLLGITRTDLTAILSLVRTGLGVAEFVQKIFEKTFPDLMDEIESTGKNDDRKLLELFSLLDYRLNQIENGIKDTQATLRNMVRSLPHLVRWEIALDTLEQYTRSINTLYHRFTYYQKHRDQVEKLTLRDFAENVISHDPDSIMSLMASVHSMASPSSPHIPLETEATKLSSYDVFGKVNEDYSRKYRRRVLALKKRDDGSIVSPTKETTAHHLAKLSLRPSVFVMLQNALKEYSYCDVTQSEQQIINGFYLMLAITEARGHAMINYAYMLLRSYKEGNYTLEMKISRDLYKHYTENLLKESMHVLNKASTSFHRCDPENHVEGKTYVRVTELLQGYIENEVDMNSGGTCMNSCKSYQVAKSEGCYLPDKQYCGKHKRCKGTLHDCTFFDADAWVCISKDKHRRYDWIEYEDGTKLGSAKKCDNVMKVDSWWRWFAHCSYCMCLCDDPSSPTSDRFVSLMSSISDERENKVVTGLKFVKSNRVIHIQVQEGSALPQGQVDPETVRWVPIQPITVESKDYQDGVHYKTLSYANKKIDLDHLKAPRHHVITGVKFRMLGSHVNLEIKVSPVNFTTGEVKFTKSYWLSNDNTPSMALSPRKELKLSRPNVPTKSPAMSEIDSIPDTFITFTPTSLFADVSQTTAPYFDSQPVAPLPPTWFSEIELYHKGRRDYGGFLGVKIYNYNITSHFIEDNSKQGENDIIA